VSSGAGKTITAAKRSKPKVTAVKRKK
jgi:hypothetical protein